MEFISLIVSACLMLCVHGEVVDVKSDHSLEERVEALERKLEYVLEENSRIKRAQPMFAEPVSFSAVVDHGNAGLAIGQKIVFNNAYINDRNGYNTGTGVFTAPVGGVYMFSYFVAEYIVNDNAEQIVVKLVHNGRNLVDAVAESLHANHNDQGGNVVIVRMTEGDEVWVEVFDTTGVHLDAAPGYLYNSFSGVLLYAD